MEDSSTGVVGVDGVDGVDGVGAISAILQILTLVTYIPTQLNLIFLGDTRRTMFERRRSDPAVCEGAYLVTYPF